MTHHPSIPAHAIDWHQKSRRARRGRIARTASLYAFLSAVSVPLIVPYIGLVAMAFGSNAPGVIWPAVAVILPWLGAIAFLLSGYFPRNWVTLAAIALTLIAAAFLKQWIGSELSFRNFLFLLERPRPSLPSFWSAFANSAILALANTAIVATVASGAGYYLSRHAFPGRNHAIAALLTVHAFPVITLIIPLFLMIWSVGLLNQLGGVVFVLVAMELPFAIIIMKGFFDAVPWEIEMSALSDGATRRQAYYLVVLPQVRNGLIAVGVFAFIRGWEEYIFVSTFLITQPNWVLSQYLFFENNSAAVALVYLIPPLILFLMTQKYLMKISVSVARG